MICCKLLLIRARGAGVDKHMKKKEFDVRLACLMAAINVDWEDLETEEVNCALVARVRKNIERVFARA